jgi:hypothetical protein
MRRRPFYAQPMPSPNRATPLQNRATPNQNRATPNQNRATPLQNRATPNQNRATPLQNRATPLQNRVTPLGALIATPERGLVYANRGCLHDAAGRIRRRYPTRRWIACLLEFRGRRRHPLMTPGRFTELFFLDGGPRSPPATGPVESADTRTTST